MSNPSQAYGTVALLTANPRELEASLLLRAGSRLQAIYDSWDRSRDELDEALLFNRKLWTLFIASVTREDNPLPAAIRQNIANLGLFVMNQTVALTADPKRERLSPLVSINREVAAGLRARA